MRSVNVGIIFGRPRRCIDPKPRRLLRTYQKSISSILSYQSRQINRVRGLQTSIWCRSVASFAAASEQDLIDSELDAILLRLRIIAQEPDIQRIDALEVSNLMEACLSICWADRDSTRAMRLWGVCKSLLDAISALGDAEGATRSAEALGIALERLGSDLALEGYWKSAKDSLLRTYNLLEGRLHPSSFYNLAVISLYGQDKDLNQCRLWIERGLSVAPQDEDLLLFLAQTFALEAKGAKKKDEYVKKILDLLSKVSEITAQKEGQGNHLSLYNPKHAQLLSWALLKRKKGTVPYFDSFPYSPIDVTHRAIEMFPEESESWAAHAKALLDLQGLPSMLEAYEEGLKAAPSLELYWKYAVALIYRQENIRDGVNILKEAETKSELLPPRFRREHSSDPDDVTLRLGALSKFLEDELKLPFPVHWAKAFVASILAAIRGDFPLAEKYFSLAASASSPASSKDQSSSSISENKLLRARFDETVRFIRSSKNL